LDWGEPLTVNSRQCAEIVIWLSFRAPAGAGVNSARNLSGFECKEKEGFLGTKRASE
jgi:hypothetical protein